MQARMIIAVAAIILVMSICKPSLAREQQPELTVAEARAIAKEAYIYGFPMVDSYRVLYSYFVDTTSKSYKGNWNQLHHEASVYTPADKGLQAAAVDVCPSVLGADLRAEPLVISVPAVEKGRYYAMQFIDAYTFSFAYVGSRATGNEAGNYLLAGPNWSGDKPEGIKEIIPCETEFALVLCRTQLFDANDLERVQMIQAGYRVQPLSKFLGRPAPIDAARIDFPKPLSSEAERTSIEFFTLLNFVMRFCPLHLDEAEIRARMANLGIRGDESFDVTKLSPEIKSAMQAGITYAWKEFDDFKANELDLTRETRNTVYGNRDRLEGQYLIRMVGAVLGIHGNSVEEAIEVKYLVDFEDDPLDATHYRYELRLEPGNYPPVKGFWSLTMYEWPSGSLVENPLQRYLINSSMLNTLKRDEEGDIRLYLMHDSPGREKEPNWLPAPKGPFMVVLRLYWPEESELDGNWSTPDLRFRLSLDDEVLSDEVLEADTEENFARQIKSLVTGISQAKSVTLYEGLPHQRREAKVLFDELRTKKTIELHGFPFYDVAVPIEARSEAKLIKLCGEKATFGRYQGAKFCGGFHPDCCLEFKDGTDVYQMLICFGCREARLYGPQGKVFSDLDQGALKSFVEILSVYQKNRPQRIKKKGAF